VKPLLFLVVVLLAPMALADHAYSHRYVFEGRLLGYDGLPLPGREVEFLNEGETFLAPCREGLQESITNEQGDFRFCFHHHDIATGASVGARSGNASIMRAVDVAFRKTHVILVEPNETGIAPAGWNETYRVSGRAWQVGVQELEGVQVYGIAVIGLPVNLTVRDPQGGESVFRTTTDAFGDYDLLVETAESPGDLSLTIEVLGRAQPAKLEAHGHRTYAPLYVPAGAPPPTGSGGSEPAPAPGAATPRVSPVLVIALGLALVAAIVISRRRER